MINDLPMRKPNSNESESQVTVSAPIIPHYGIGERVFFDDGSKDIGYVTGIIIRGTGMFTYLVSEKGMESEVRDFELTPYVEPKDDDEGEGEEV
jgi:hypothetical protein